MPHQRHRNATCTIKTKVIYSLFLNIELMRGLTIEGFVEIPIE